MAKKIKFSLEMADGLQVRTIEDLRENFNLEKVLEYFIDGRLATWLNDRYYENEAEMIEKLSKDNHEIKKIICEIFDVEYQDDNELDIEEIQYKKQKLDKLKQFTDDEEILSNAGNVAFNQEELAELLDEDATSIYLCGEKFTIPLSKENITYVGVNNPTAVIKSKILIDFAVKNIVLKCVNFNEEYQNLINHSIKNENSKGTFTSGSYETSSLFDFMMKSNDKEASSNLFNVICVELSGINYDIDKNTKSKVDVIKQANLVEAFDNYLNKIS